MLYANEVVMKRISNLVLTVFIIIGTTSAWAESKGPATYSRISLDSQATVYDGTTDAERTQMHTLCCSSNDSWDGTLRYCQTGANMINQLSNNRILLQATCTYPTSEEYSRCIRGGARRYVYMQKTEAVIFPKEEPVGN